MPDRMSEALARLEQALSAVSHPLSTALRPGLDPDDLRTLTAPTGLRLPDEAVALWEWRDGVDPELTTLPRVPGSELLPGGGYFLPLDSAVETYLWFRENFPWSDLDDLSPDWFPAISFGHGAIIWIDCPRDPASLGRAIYWGADEYNLAEEMRRRTLPSVAEGVEWWAWLLESSQWLVRNGGLWTFVDDPEPHPWIP